jgi:CRP/FNR family transcriptional regulator
MLIIKTHNEILFHHLKDLKACRGLSDEALKQIAEVSSLKKVKKNDFLWRVGDPGEFAALIISGMFEISKNVGRRNETCMGLFSTNDLVGLSAIYKKNSYPGSCKALTSGAEVIKLYLRPIANKTKDAIAEEISFWIRDNLLLHEQIVRDKVDFLCAGSIEERVFEAIDHLARRFGQPVYRDIVYIPLKITRNQIARMIDSRVETVIRTINQWNKKDLIQWDQEGIKVKLMSLEKHIQSRIE